jgi:hypothetical protein
MLIGSPIGPYAALVWAGMTAPQVGLLATGAVCAGLFLMSGDVKAAYRG